MADKNDIKAVNLKSLETATSTVGLVTFGVDNNNIPYQVPYTLMKGDKGDKGDKGETGNYDKLENRLNINRFGYNVSIYGLNGGIHTLETAIKDVPPEERFVGQKITFDSTSGWVTYHNNSLAISDYENPNNWIQEEGLKQITGDIIITNQPDDEDLTSEGSNLLKFADKLYSKTTASGLGRVFLRKNITDGINTLNQSMISLSNTIYKIQYDYDLQGGKISIPNNCTLEFEGGSISNGIIEFLDTTISANVYNIFKEISILGTFTNENIYPEWFGAKGDNSSDDTLPIQTALTVASKGAKYIVFNSNVTYNISKSLRIVDDNVTLQGNGATLNWTTTEGISFNMSIRKRDYSDADSWNKSRLKNCTLENLNFIGGATGVLFTNADNCKVINCNFKENFGNSVSFYFSTNILTSGCTCSPTGYYCIMQYQCKEFIIRDCILYGQYACITVKGSYLQETYTKGMITNNVLYVQKRSSGISTGSVAEEGIVRNTTVIGNHFKGMGSQAIGLRLGDNAEEYIIKGNKFDGCSVSLGGGKNIVEGNEIANVQNVPAIHIFDNSNENIISSNRITNTTEENAINVKGANNTVIGNYIDNATVGGIKLLDATTCKNNMIAGNTIKNTTLNGIIAEGDLSKNNYIIFNNSTVASKSSNSICILDFNETLMLPNLRNGLMVEGKTRVYGSEIPTSGSHSRGDIIYNYYPSPVSDDKACIGWVCTAEGTPGQWHPFGQIQKLGAYRLSGTTDERPNPTKGAGNMYFDTTLRKPIWWDGKTWVDATGTEV